jgi:hypothetical protein
MPRRVPEASGARFSSYGGVVAAAVLGILAALLGFVGVSRDHPVTLDGGSRNAPRHLKWGQAPTTPNHQDANDSSTVALQPVPE